ncbi:hypothetical protein RN001_006473 [Aquatica leii]|uniref:RING-type domain-containing protein n=1 Tax=Aquatica leii TaxID=1421715 RepID=A0AAN7SJV0_9COLE|nr:hypothetical protein RN001_006473 [Aquatica leii]
MAQGVVLDDLLCRCSKVDCDIAPINSQIISASNIRIIKMLYLKSLECPICFELMTKDISQCSAGHSFCRRCSVLISQCSICKNPMLYVRNYTLENVIKELANFTKIRQQCLLSTTCEIYNDDPAFMLNHLTDQHQDDLFKFNSKSGLKFTLKLNQKERHAFFIKIIHCVDLFFKFYVKVNDDNKMIYCGIVAMERKCNGTFDVDSEPRIRTKKYSAKFAHIEDEPFNFPFTVIPKLVCCKISASNIRIIKMLYLKSLECPICFELMTKDISQCSAGHSICRRCSVLISQCSICRKPMLYMRNYTLENIIKDLANLTKIRQQCLLSTTCEIYSDDPAFMLNHLTDQHRDDLFKFNSKSGLKLTLKLNQKERHAFFLKMIYCVDLFFKFYVKVNDDNKMIYCGIVAMERKCNGTFDVDSEPRIRTKKYSAKFAHIEDDPFNFPFTVIPKLVCCKSNHQFACLQLYLNLNF